MLGLACACTGPPLTYKVRCRGRHTTPFLVQVARFLCGSCPKREGQLIHAVDEVFDASRSEILGYTPDLPGTTNIYEHRQVREFVSTRKLLKEFRTASFDGGRPGAEAPTRPVLDGAAMPSAPDMSSVQW